MRKEGRRLISSSALPIIFTSSQIMQYTVAGTVKHTHTHTHTLNLFHHAQKALVEPQATALLKSNMLVFCGSYLANSCRTDVRSQLKASSMQPASSAYKLRVQIRYNPLPLFCSGLKKLSEINLIHANVPKRNGRFS